MTVENFVRILWTVFEKIEKEIEKWLFLTSQSNDFDVFAHAGSPLRVE